MDSLKYRYPDTGDKITVNFIDGNNKKYWEESEDRILHLIENSIGKVNSFLDIGCGLGRLLLRFGESANAIVGIEPDTDRFIMCKENIENTHIKDKVTLYNDSLDALNFESRFDFILCSHVLQHISNDNCKKLIQSIAHNLEPDGKLVVLTNHSDKDHDIYINSYIKEDQTIEREISNSEFNQLTSKVGSLPIRFFSIHTLENMIKPYGLRIASYEVFHLKNTNHLFYDSIVNTLPFLKKKHGRDMLLIITK